MRARDYRRIAREQLAGHWRLSVFVVFVATFLGGAVGGSSFSLDLFLPSQAVVQERFPALLPILTPITKIAGGIGILRFLAGGAVAIGNARYHLDQHDGRLLDFSTLLSGFNHLGAGLCVKLLTGLFQNLWGIAFVIPGILLALILKLDPLDPFCTLALVMLFIIPYTLAKYSYCMSFYILAEYPEMTAREAIRESKDLMRGNRWKLFCLKFSFIGWIHLSVLTLGIGALFLGPYISAAYAVFYRQLKAPRTYT